MKKRAKAGFTLVEMLCSVILVILVSIGLANGVQLAVENYTRSIIHSESQVLCETLTTAVSDKLRNCKEISPNADPIQFFSEGVGQNSSFVTDEAGHVLLGNQAQLAQGEKKLLPDRAYPYGIRASVTLDKYDTDTQIFYVTVQVKDSTDTEVLASSVFEVHCLNKPLTVSAEEGSYEKT